MAEQIEPVRRGPCLPRAQHLAARAHQILHIGPRREGKLHADPFQAGKPVVEETDTLMGHSNLIDIGKNEENVVIFLFESLRRKVQLAVYVS